MTVRSVFGSSPPPGSFGVFTDNPPSITPGGRFYRYGGILPSATIVGARVWLPAAAPGSTAIRIMVWLSGTMADTPDREAVVPISGTGWQDATFTTPAAMPADGVAVRVGYQFVGNPATYVFTNTFRENAAGLPIHPQDNGLTFSELRSIFRDGTGPEAEPVTLGFSIYYGVDLLVEDGQGGPVEPPPNVPPTARAGLDQTVASQAAVTISGSGTTDPDGTVTSYAWVQTGGPVVILNGTGATRTFVAPEGPATLAFRLTVTDDDGDGSQDAVVVTVTAPPSPVGSSLLTDDDLAFMRETQAEARPTEAELIRVTQGATASGGRGETRAAPVPVNVRLDGKEKAVPNVVAAVIGSAKAVKVAMDMVPVNVGDIIRVGTAEYQVITGSDPDEWATTQIVWAKRVKGG